MTAEFETRLEDIRSGPWRALSQLARTRLPELTPAETHRYLRPHYLDPAGVTDPDEIKFRESFDQVLEELQILELAVACGYLPLDAVRPAAMPDFDAFILPQVAARGYLVSYDFVLVRYLASRLELDLRLDPLTPPPIEERASVRFATFLAVHTEFTSNPVVERFTMLLDDYRFGGLIDAPFLAAHVEHEPGGLNEKQQAAFRAVLQGLVEFVQILGDFFTQVDSDQQPLFGCAYAYWLSHFFGERRIASGYERLGTSFGGLRFGTQFVSGGLDPRAIDAEHTRLHRRIETLRTVWTRTRKLIESLDSGTGRQASADGGK